MRCSPPDTKSALAAEGDHLLLTTMWADELTVTILLIATTKHLLNGVPRSFRFWILAQKLLKPIAKDLFEGLKRGWLRLNHPGILAESNVCLFGINNLKRKFQGDQVLSDVTADAVWHLRRASRSKKAKGKRR